MAFKSNNTVIGNKEPQKEATEKLTPEAEQYQLSAQELAFLLNIMRKTNFLGEHVEITYNVIAKLQNQYLSQQPK